MRLLVLKIRAWTQIFQHFSNPVIVTLLRIGWLRMPYFLYQIRRLDARYRMLARPAADKHSDLSILRTVLVEEEYEAILKSLPKGPVRLVDIGANLGSFTVWIQQRHGLRQAFCFEPEPTSFSLCEFNLKVNRCEDAVVYPNAIGGRDRMIEMAIDSARPGSINIYGEPSSQSHGRKQVEVVALRKWLATVEGDFDLLKMDCESAEWEILRQTPAIDLRRFKLLVAEVHYDPDQQSSPRDFHVLVEAAGFETIRDDGHEFGLYIAIRRDGK